jgi:hypothetical protein
LLRAALGAVALLITGAIVELWFLWAGNSLRSAVALAAVLASTATAGIAARRARAGKRLRTALDAYADLEIARSDRHRRKRACARFPAPTTDEAALLRGWIDQGAEWSARELPTSPTMGRKEPR